jgi:asparagine synthase (glutamine-hydrolysing)
LRSDVPLSVFLSGGMDSGSIVAGIENSKFSLNTYSAVYGKNLKGDEKDYILELKNDVKKMNFIKIDANSFNADLNNFLACHESEPIVDPSTYAGFKVFEEAKKKIKVTLNGQGADEQLGGYLYFWGHYYKSLLKKGRIDQLCTELFHYYKNQKNLKALNYLIYYLLPDSIKNRYRVNNPQFLTNDFKNQYIKTSNITKLIDKSINLQDSLIRHFNYKLQHLLKWEDLNSMYYSVESRLPFLDYRLVERTLSMNQSNILNKGQTKYILRNALKGDLPEKIRKRNEKVGFETPADNWFRTEYFKNFAMNVLKSDHMKDMAIIDPKKAINLYKMHLNGRKNISSQIWKWINLDHWFQTHFN